MIMRVIPLRAVPNQRLSFSNGSDLWEIEIKVATVTMVCSLWLNNKPVLLGSRIVAGVPLIPYPRLAANGNFLILTADDEEPWWELFESTQQMVFSDD